MTRQGTRRESCATAALCAVLLAACADEPPASVWQVAEDTVGGVLRIENTPPTSGATPTLLAEEEWRIGSVEGGGPTSFGVIRALAVLPDGRVAVADGQAEEVRLFDSEGRYLRTFGGKGAGPGELEGMQGVHLDHQGMLRVAEQANARLSVFHPDSGYVTSFPLRLHSYGFRGPWDAVMDSGGRTLVASSGRYGTGSWNMVRVYDASMNQVDSIPYRDYTDISRRAIGGGNDDDFPGVWRVSLGDGAWSWAEVPFHSPSHEVLGPTGEFWSSTEGEQGLVIARWRPPGDTSLVFTSRRRPAPVTAAERDSAISALRERLAERTATPPRLDPSRVPASKPPLYGLSLDGAGRLWVRLSEPNADTTVYDVFSRDGVHAETVWLPVRIDRYVPPVVRDDALWAVVTDDLDVQYVVRANLRPPPAGTDR